MVLVVIIRVRRRTGTLRFHSGSRLSPGKASGDRSFHQLVAIHLSGTTRLKKFLFIDLSNSSDDSLSYEQQFTVSCCLKKFKTDEFRIATK